MHSNLCLLVVVLISSFVSSAKGDLCITMNVMKGVNFGLFKKGSYDNSSSYFCADGAPYQYKCRCSHQLTCSPAYDPWGRNIGQCSCCRPYVYILLIVIMLLSFFILAIVAYKVVCQNKWWCDGYPKPLRVAMPRKGYVAPCAPGPVFPPRLFEGYHDRQFIDGESSSGEQITHRGGNASGHHSSRSFQREEET